MGSDYFYEGTNDGFDPNYGGTSQTYSGSSSYNIGFATDPRTANQLKQASDKLNTGATTVEVGGISGDVFESIPKEHFKELNRLRKLVGGNVELTLHAPLIEPTGLSKRGWEPHEREQAERQMTQAIMKAHDLNPEGNVVTTFHASVVGQPAETVEWVGEENKKKAVVKEIMVIDERSGGVQPLSLKTSAFEGNKFIAPEKKIEEINNSNWYKTLQTINYRAEHGVERVKEAQRHLELNGPKEKKAFNQLYKDYASGNDEKFRKDLSNANKTPEAEEAYKQAMQVTSAGEIDLRDAYNGLREMFDQAYETFRNKSDAKSKENISKLDKYREKIAPHLTSLQSPEKINELAEAVREGVHVLRAIDTPQILKPFREFALDKSAETFGNVAFNAFDKFGDKAPIVSIENPPAGQGILHTGGDLKELVARSRKQFISRAMNDNGLSEDEAKRQAEKLIGVTWDVGHINMLRKFGAGKEELRMEAEKIAPLVKHVHLSDNFGMEHTELPMGMGNVGEAKMLEEIEKQTKKFKKVVEVGNWYQHFQTTPFGETLQAFNSPIYAMKNASYWGPSGGYFSGFGNNPDVHHSLYGAGFANLPVELGGQMSGRSRVSGNPME